MEEMGAGPDTGFRSSRDFFRPSIFREDRLASTITESKRYAFADEYLRERPHRVSAHEKAFRISYRWLAGVPSKFMAGECSASDSLYLADGRRHRCK
jgi:hypothetical protein